MSDVFALPGAIGSRIQHIEISRHPLLAERFTERVVNTAKTAERLNVAEQVYNPRMLVPGRGDHHEQLSDATTACASVDATGHFAGTRIGAPLSLTKNTRNLAGAVWLAFRLTTCTSSGPS